MAIQTPTLHASAVLLGRRAILIRGAAGAGKSGLALGLLRAAETGAIRFARLVGDDRIQATAHHGTLVLRPAAALAGLLEVRGLGIRRVPFEAVAVAGLVVDLGAAADRMPDADERETTILGIRLSRLALGRVADPVSHVLAFYQTLDGGLASEAAERAQHSSLPLGVCA
jgi:serine kinase of HPr protein (carbohydrate metabolism regulator)